MDIIRRWHSQWAKGPSIEYPKPPISEVSLILQVAKLLDSANDEMTETNIKPSPDGMTE